MVVGKLDDVKALVVRSAVEVLVTAVVEGTIDSCG